MTNSRPGPPQQRDAGAAMVEFALVLPLFLLMMLGVLGFGIAFHAQQELSTAAQEGARALYLGRTPAEAEAAAVAAVRLNPPFPSRPDDSAAVLGCSGGQRAVELRRTETVELIFFPAVTVNVLGRSVAPC
jgi:hypothetical protein